MARTKLMDCGHGSRHLSPYDGRCRVCVREAKARSFAEKTVYVKPRRDLSAVDAKKLAVAQNRKLTAERHEAEAKKRRDAAA